MTELFGFPAPESLSEYCELCNDRAVDGECPCESYRKATKEQQEEMDKVIYGED